MVESEIKHPLGQEIDKIFSALFVGYDQERGDLLRDMVDFNFSDAFNSDNNIGMLLIANWCTRNLTFVEVPAVLPVEDHRWLVDTEEGVFPVLQRVTIKDLVGRPFKLEVGELIDTTPFFQINVVGEGLVLTSETNGVISSVLGRYESKEYDQYQNIARNLGGISSMAAIVDTFN